MPKLIALTGPAGAGKTTVASYLEDDGWVRVSFAQPLKDAVFALGVDTSDAQKETPCSALGGVSPRVAYQRLGDAYRAALGDAVFIRAAMAAAGYARDDGKNVVVDDLRYASEAASIRASGGDVILLTERAKSGVPAHSSESGVAGHLVTRAVSNAGDLDVTIAEILHPVPEGWSHEPPKISGLYHIRWCLDNHRGADVASLDVSGGDWTSTEEMARTACADPAVLWGPRIEPPS